MNEELTTEQQAEIMVHQIIQATKNRIVNLLAPQFDRLSAGHAHFDKGLANAILNDIKNA